MAIFPHFQQIDAICRAHPAARRLAVENFLLSLDPSVSAQYHLRNLRGDARLYRWGRATVDAIAAGVRLAYGGRVAP